MQVNWKRRIFILFSLALYYTDLSSDIAYLLTTQGNPSTILLIILLIQPTFYLVYYYLTLATPVLCKESSESCLSCILSLFCRAPLYTILCELKLMLTPLYSLVSQEEAMIDRMKPNFLPYLLIHSIFQSLPMTIYQFLLMSDVQNPNMILWVSPCVSGLSFFYCFFVIHILRKMNSGGLTWIQMPKPTIQFYSMKTGKLIADEDFDD